jgi:tetratricopeptide (TPR) repeat protein
VASAAVLLVTLVGALAIGIYAVNREKKQTERALVAEAKAKRRTRQALDEMSSQVIDNWLSRQGTKLEPAQEEFLKRALAYYQEFAEEAGDSEEIRREVANAYRRVGDIARRLAQHATASEAYRSAIRHYKQLTTDYPTTLEYRLELAWSHNNLGALLVDLGKRVEAEAAYRAALKLQEELAAQHPAIPQCHNDLAGTLVNLANLLRQQQHYTQARELLEQAEPYHQAALKTNPSHPTYRRFYRNNRGILAEIQTGLGEHAAAARTAEQLASFGVEPATDAYNAACVLALCVPLAEKDIKLPEAERPKQAHTYGDRAMALLRQAIAKGYQDAAYMKQDADLKPLHARPEFQQLLKELEAKAKATKP